MSAVDEDIPNVGDGDRRGCRGGDGNNDDDDDEDVKKGLRKYGFQKDIGKAKQVVLRQFSKAKKQLHNRRHKKALRTSSESGAAIANRASGYYAERGTSRLDGCQNSEG
ncbi:hypothetical protein K1719_035465 [Acacia pycnantha]|nr:hypothetical protein K1719_037039 [Acacia pycnantha]KAI9082596.1 hypothetical protein K1719_035465 [Acacia pycnantha]